MAADDKDWAAKYLLDPLTAPEPSQETGPGTHYNSTFSPTNPYASTSTSAATPRHSQDRKTNASINVAEISKTSRNPYPSPLQSASPQQSRFKEHFASSRNSAMSQASTEIPTSTAGGATVTSDGTGRQRNNSLPSRHPGDSSNRPLDIIRRESRKAHRSPHLRKSHHPGADSIDILDTIGAKYHHEGPYDAALLARNTDYKNSPVEAVRSTNEEALRATPPEKIQDSLKRHIPLDGTAVVPPGSTDQLGRTYNYEEGTDMMIENGGNYKRWPGVTYLPDDLKGKGEPSYSIEKALKDHKRSSRHGRKVSGDIEMTTPRTPHTPQSPQYRDSVGEDSQRPRSMDSSSRPASDGQRYSDWENGLRRSGSGTGVGGSIRRRFGSLRRKDGH